jgi:hypothetical protein
MLSSIVSRTGPTGAGAKSVSKAVGWVNNVGRMLDAPMKFP